MIGDNVTSVWADIMYNHVVVGLYDFSEEQIALFRVNIFDSPMLHFVHEPGRISSALGRLPTYAMAP